VFACLLSPRAVSDVSRQINEQRKFQQRGVIRRFLMFQLFLEH
jgi:hypothetical protein